MPGPREDLSPRREGSTTPGENPPQPSKALWRPLGGTASSWSVRGWTGGLQPDETRLQGRLHGGPDAPPLRGAATRHRHPLALGQQGRRPPQRARMLATTPGGAMVCLVLATPPAARLSHPSRRSTSRLKPEPESQPTPHTERASLPRRERLPSTCERDHLRRRDGRSERPPTRRCSQESLDAHTILRTSLPAAHRREVHLRAIVLSRPPAAADRYSSSPGRPAPKSLGARSLRHRGPPPGCVAVCITTLCPAAPQRRSGHPTGPKALGHPPRTMAPARQNNQSLVVGASAEHRETSPRALYRPKATATACGRSSRCASHPPAGRGRRTRLRRSVPRWVRSTG